MSGIIEDDFNYLIQSGPERGCYPNTTKRVLVVHPDNIEDGILFCARHGFKIRPGACYLGGFIGDDASKQEWLIGRM